MDLLRHLRHLADAFPAAAPISVRRLASGSAFITRSARTFGRVCPERALVALVLEGCKHVTQAGRRSLLRRGDVLIAPSGVAYESTVTPDSESGHFCVFIAELSGEAAAAFTRDNPALSSSGQVGAFEADRVHVVRAELPVLQAFAHFAATLLTPNVHPVLVQHRLADLLLSLSLQHAKPTQATTPDLVLAIRRLFRRDLARTLPAAEVARRLAMSPSTLRRQLAKIGVSLRQLRADERMAVAAVLLRQREARVAEVAARCGYGSPSKFAKQFRRHFGHAPSETGLKSSG